ncbi:MAG: glutamine synthetase family protein [Bacteroidales bacterium]
MNTQQSQLNSNELENFIGKPASEFQRNDLVKFIEAHQIRMLNFRYIAEDGKLKSLNFVIQSLEYLEQLLTFGERVDGSSLFSYISAGSSDLYVIPRYKTAFVNPFSEIPALEILCSFYTSQGKPLDNSPDQILRKAHALFRERTGMQFKAMGELEYYISSPKEELYLVPEQKGYHESAPFSKWEQLRHEASILISRAGGKVKYSHNEVGNFSSVNELFEQHEIEFLPEDVEDAADQLVIAKWILRMLSYKNGVEISFGPKISEGMAGSGLHIHMMVLSGEENILSDNTGITDAAKKMIAGILDTTGALTAFGNTVPTSYVRLVPEQEAPTRICWGDRNRSVLVRIPLGWLGNSNMIGDANPQEKELNLNTPERQTFEFRAPDGSADIHSLMAGLVLASLHGLEMNNSLELAESLYVDEDIYKNREKYVHLDHLPASCYESAAALQAKRHVFEKDRVFPVGMIDHVIEKLQSYNDQLLSKRVQWNKKEIRNLILKYIHV